MCTARSQDHHPFEMQSCAAVRHGGHSHAKDREWNQGEQQAPCQLRPSARRLVGWTLQMLARPGEQPQSVVSSPRPLWGPLPGWEQVTLAW